MARRALQTPKKIHSHIGMGYTYRWFTQTIQIRTDWTRSPMFGKDAKYTQWRGSGPSMMGIVCCTAVTFYMLVLSNPLTLKVITRQWKFTGLDGVFFTALRKCSKCDTYLFCAFCWSQEWLCLAASFFGACHSMCWKPWPLCPVEAEQLAKSWIPDVKLMSPYARLLHHRLRAFAGHLE